MMTHEAPDKIEVVVKRRDGKIIIVTRINGEQYGVRVVPEKKYPNDRDVATLVEQERQAALNRPKYKSGVDYGESMDMSIDGRMQPISITEESLARMKRVEAGEREQERIDREA